MKFPTAALDRLADTLMVGDVVFFVGAGFSIDSEGNTAVRWIARLLARFCAITEFLGGSAVPVQATEAADRGREIQRLQDSATELKEALQNSFGLKATLLTADNVTRLSEKYFEPNDWMCSAYSALVEELLKLNDSAAAVVQINAIENESLQKLRGNTNDGQPKEPVPLEPIDLPSLRCLDFRSRGKALFLDTMGFDDERIMAGTPNLDDVSDVAESYGGRLLPRYHVLARLAREGLCPALVTTNYDLLLEGAYRLAGFLHYEPRQKTKNELPQHPIERLPAITYQHFCRIAYATEFFRYGEASRTALITKIHGCAETYRKAKRSCLTGQRKQSNAGGSNPWASYLPAMVFTFREIQNWREDSWSRDYLTTLLRTRTLVFLGYSGMDPVLHDTFRTVYEEMATQRNRSRMEQVSPTALGPGEPAQAAPAYFFGLAGKTEFHGMEILRAASNAAGVEAPSLGRHPNYIQFNRGGDAPFPHIDHLLLWLLHGIVRRRQREAVETDLRRVARQCLGHSCAPAEIDAVLENLAVLQKSERDITQTWNETVESRAQFNRTVNWTAHFQAGLMRELALAETVVRRSGPGLELDDLRRWAWYFPTLDRPDWTAWGLLLELAVRRMLAAWQGRDPKKWADDSPWLRPVEDRCPAVLVSRSEHRPTPIKLTVALTGSHRRGRVADLPGVYRRRCCWEIQADTLPWRTTGIGTTPPATAIWEWASRPVEKIAREHRDIERYIGETDE